MPEQWWVCKVCRKYSRNEEEIVSCELAHTLKEKSCKVVNMLWTSTKPQEFPEYVTVKFGDSPKQEVIYKLTQLVNKHNPNNYEEIRCSRCMASSHHEYWCLYKGDVAQRTRAGSS